MESDKQRKKRLGQFFTPPEIAQFMARWVCAIHPERVLDPAVGEGALLRAVSSYAPNASLYGYDIDPICLSSASQTVSADIKLGDFLDAPPVLYDAIVANPPYIRHNHIERRHYEVANDIVKEKGITLSRLSNLYMLFVFISLRQLSSGGRAAFLVPAEWANANFGDALKQYFHKTGVLRRVLYFSHTAEVFDDNLSTGCILLIENTKSNAPVQTCVLDDVRQIQYDDQHVFRTFSTQELLAPKWNSLLRGVSQDALLTRNLIRLGDIALTRRGIATGANSYFMMSRDEAKARGISFDHLIPCISKATDIVGSQITKGDFTEMLDRGKRCLLFSPSSPLSEYDAAYIRHGEASGASSGYICRKRRLWYKVEVQTPAPILAGVFNRKRCRFILNDARLLSLSCFHGIYPYDSRSAFTRALHSLLNTDVIQRIALDHTRVYGKGLSKFEPKDLLDIQIPDIRLADDTALARLSGLNANAELDDIISILH